MCGSVVALLWVYPGLGISIWFVQIMINDHNHDIEDGNNIANDDQTDEKNLGGETGLGKVDAKEGWERTRVDIDLGIANCLVEV